MVGAHLTLIGYMLVLYKQSCSDTYCCTVTGAIKMVPSAGGEIEKKLKRRRTWQPLDNHNSAYQELLLARKSLSATDHIEHNVVSGNSSNLLLLSKFRQWSRQLQIK